jgi:hypothetical protein
MATHSETQEEMVVYSHDGKTWVRPLSMWNQLVEWQDGILRPRFVLVEEGK